MESTPIDSPEFLPLISLCSMWAFFVVSWSPFKCWCHSIPHSGTETPSSETVWPRVHVSPLSPYTHSPASVEWHRAMTRPHTHPPQNCAAGAFLDSRKLWRFWKILAYSGQRDVLMLMTIILYSTLCMCLTVDMYKYIVGLVASSDYRSWHRYYVYMRFVASTVFLSQALVMRLGRNEMWVLKGLSGLINKFACLNECSAK